MNAKQLKFLSVFEEMSRAGFTDEATVKKHFPAVLRLDFALALDLWDYICSAYENDLAASKDVAALLGGTVADMFYKQAAQKTVKALADLPSVRRAVYQYSPRAGEGVAFGILVDLLSANKTDAADDLLKCLLKNGDVPYGPTMKKLLERVFIELMKKNPAKKMEMPRKLATLLLSYVSKIKTDEKAMLEQRIRETM